MLPVVVGRTLLALGCCLLCFGFHCNSSQPRQAHSIITLDCEREAKSIIKCCLLVAASYVVLALPLSTLTMSLKLLIRLLCDFIWFLLDALLPASLPSSTARPCSATDTSALAFVHWLTSETVLTRLYSNYAATLVAKQQDFTAIIRP